MTTKNTALIDNFVASPQVMSPVYQLHGRVRSVMGTVALATGDIDAGDIVLIAPVPSGATIKSIQLASDDLDSGTPALTWDLGLYTTAATPVAVDINYYGTVITLGQAVTVFTEYSYDARPIEDCGQRVWEDAAVSSDPGGHYYIALTVNVTAATAVAGDVSFIIEYVLD